MNFFTLLRISTLTVLNIKVIDIFAGAVRMFLIDAGLAAKGAMYEL